MCNFKIHVIFSVDRCCFNIDYSHLCHIILSLYCVKTRLQNIHAYTRLTSNEMNKWNNGLSKVLWGSLCVHYVFFFTGKGDVSI